MVFYQLLIIIFGFVLIAKSANEIIKSLIRVAGYLGFTEFAISFLLVGVISVMPELVIGVMSAVEGTPSFGLGIIFGSNIADLTLIIGTVALLSKSIKLHSSTIKQAKFLVLLIALPVLLLWDSELSRLDGLILLLAFLFYIYRVVKLHGPSVQPFIKKKPDIFFEFTVLLVCLIVVFISGNMITHAGKELSSILFLPLFFVGIILAVGTCIPELAMAVQASRKKHAELGFGDIIGNVFADCTGTIGIIALISPIRPEYPQLTVLTGIIMVGSLMALLFIFGSNKKISKREGVYLILMYILLLMFQFIVEKMTVV
ncbi:MAG: sodium:calcium antiporter [Candidatus Diapherotrites archaeon]